MAPYHILIVIISSVIPENLVLLTKSEQSGPKSAHICPTIGLILSHTVLFLSTLPILFSKVLEALRARRQTLE